MEIEALAVFPACIGSLALAVIISGWRDLRRMCKSLLFTFILMASITVVFLGTVVIVEFIGIAIVEEFFCLGTVGFVIHGGLKYGRMKLGFTKRESVLQGVIAVCGCMTAGLFFIDWTVRI